MHETLTDKLFNIIDAYYHGSDDYKELEQALEHYERIMEAVRSDSLARDGMEMIEAAMRGDS